MSLFNNLTNRQPQELLEMCRNAKEDNTHEVYCLELFRRAIVDRDDACWSALYQQYTRLVGQWVFEFAQGNTQIGDMTMEDLIQDAFTSFWRSYKAEKFPKAEEFQPENGLGSVLKYLKSCAWSSVQHARRRGRTRKVYDQAPWEEPTAIAQPALQPEVALMNRLQAERLWQVADACCTSDWERLTMRMRFVYRWTPRKILQERPDLASDEKELYNSIRNIKERMERNLEMQQLRKEMAA